MFHPRVHQTWGNGGLSEARADATRGGPSAVEAWIAFGTGLDRGLGERVVSALR